MAGRPEGAVLASSLSDADVLARTRRRPPCSSQAPRVPPPFRRGDRRSVVSPTSPTLDSGAVRGRGFAGAPPRPRPPARGTEHEHPLGSESDFEPVRTFFEGTDERRLTTASSDRSAEPLVASHEDSVPRDVSGRLSLPIGTDGRYDVWMRSDSWWDIDRGVRRRRAGWGGST